MEKLQLAITALLLTATLQAQTFDWGFALGSQAGIMEFSQHLEKDPSGNIVILPNIEQQSINLNPLGNPMYLPATTWTPPILKYSPQGELLEIKQTSGYYFRQFKIGTDNSYFCWGGYGFSNQNISLGNTPYYIQRVDSINQTYENRFIVKYQPNGDVAWAKTFACHQSSTFFYFNMDIDAAGNLYLGGTFGENVGDVVDMDFDNTARNLTALGKRDMFFAKYDANDGHLLWSFNIGMPPQCWTGNCTAKAVMMPKFVVDDAGNIYTAAEFSDQLDIDPNPNNIVYFNELNFTATALLKYDTDGNLVWGKHIASGSGYGTFELAGRDNDGNLLLSGFYGLDVDLDPSNNSAGNYSPYGTFSNTVVRYDQDGNYLWHYGHQQYASQVSIFPAQNGTYFIHYWGGDTTINVDIANNSEPCRITNDSSALAYYDANNTLISVWRKTNQRINAILVDEQNNVIITGENDGANCNYDWQGNTQINFPFNHVDGWYDAFLVKYAMLPSAVEKNNSNSALAIFPNPSHNLVNIQLLEPSTIQLFNLNGQLLSTETVETATLHTISITDLPQAVYTVKIISQSGKIYSQKLVKY